MAGSSYATASRRKILEYLKTVMTIRLQLLMWMSI